ncbi:hypothetical protein WH52_00860 [Tenacibaculum holothuriorum]|uniref:Uncharacterized protein n=1 Tax=Tenacibaculum holothuriorum TaxID=1635173 RepID=A0A1Y2PHP8_9FLAO|nr:hypothetical protein WH52_00860 [Tenacibaculum holothuriorum]
MIKKEKFTINTSTFDSFILKIQKNPNLTLIKTSKDSFIIKSRNSFKYFFFDLNPGHINSIKINGLVKNIDDKKLVLNFEIKINIEFYILMFFYLLISFFVYLNYKSVSIYILLIIPLILFFCYNSYKTNESILYNNVKSLLKE